MRQFGVGVVPDLLPLLQVVQSSIMQSRKRSWKWPGNEASFPPCYIRIQFELMKIARPFLLQPGNEASLHGVPQHGRMPVSQSERYQLILS